MSYEESREGVWVLAEQIEGKIHSVTYELIGKGKELASSLDTGLGCIYLTADDDKKVDELIYRGVDKIYLIKDSSFNSPDEIVYMENIVNLVNEYRPEIFLIGATNFGRSLAPRVAAALGTGLTADCTGLEIDEDGEFVQIRPAFTGNVLAHIYTDRYPKMSTVRYKEFPEADRNMEREGEIIREKAVKNPLSNEIKILKEIMPEEVVGLEDAEIVVSAGRGIKDKKNLELIQKLADKLGAKLGVSRPLVDDGWINKAHQVGYSGRRVKPKLYVACGISGSSQHLAGMKESEVIIAINSDPSAPIFSYSDYGIVGDLFEVIPKLIEELDREV